MSSTTSRRLARVWELLNAAEGASALYIHVDGLSAALDGGEAWKALREAWNDPFPFKPGDTIPSDEAIEWLDAAPEGTRVESIEDSGVSSGEWEKIPRLRIGSEVSDGWSPAPLLEPASEAARLALSSYSISRSATVIVRALSTNEEN